MTWTLIDIASPEELAWGYTPAPSFKAACEAENTPSDMREIRRYLVTLFAGFALLAGVQNLFTDHQTDGQRRLAEMNLTERKTECRDCGSIAVSAGNRSDTP